MRMVIGEVRSCRRCVRRPSSFSTFYQAPVKLGGKPCLKIDGLEFMSWADAGSCWPAKGDLDHLLWLGDRCFSWSLKTRAISPRATPCARPVDVDKVSKELSCMSASICSLKRCRFRSIHIEDNAVCILLQAAARSRSGLA